MTPLEIRSVLKSLWSQSGKDLINDSRKLRGMLLDYSCGENELEINLIIAALQYGSVEELNRFPVSEIDEISVAQCQKRLQTKTGISSENAKWSIEAWIYAMDKTICFENIHSEQAAMLKSITAQTPSEEFNRSEEQSLQSADYSANKIANSSRDKSKVLLIVMGVIFFASIGIGYWWFSSSSDSAVPLKPSLVASNSDETAIGYTIITEGTYRPASNEMDEVAKERAFLQATNSAKEQAVDYLEKHAKTINQKISKDEIKAVIFGLIKVEIVDSSKSILEKGDPIFRVKVKATVTTRNLMYMVNTLREESAIAGKYKEVQQKNDNLEKLYLNKLKGQDDPRTVDHRWYKDDKKGVFVWNASPFPGESIEWEGGIKDINNVSFANGPGVLKWFRYGKYHHETTGIWLIGKLKNSTYAVSTYPDGTRREGIVEDGLINENNWRSVSNFNNGSLLIWNPSPVEGEKVSWNGGMISQYKLIGEETGYPVFYAHGYGKATWSVNGTIVQSDEGNHFGGKRHGKIIQRFADGRIVESYWENGIRVVDTKGLQSEDFAVGPISLSTTSDKVIGILGDKYTIERFTMTWGGSNTLFHRYEYQERGIIVTVVAKTGKLVDISTSSAEYPAPRGVRVGDNHSIMFEKYGNPYKSDKTKDGNLIYQYNATRGNANLSLIVNPTDGKIITIIMDLWSM